MMIVHADAVTPAPWKNGGGWARDLLRLPAAGDWQIRISLADIEADGPFSAYPGAQRWFAVVEGAGVELEFAGGSRVVRSGDAAIEFDGAAAPGCRLLDGPTRDLNLMLRDGARGVMRRAEAGVAWAEDWPQRGRYDIATRTLEWGLPAGPLHGDGPSLWIGVAP